MGEQRRRLAILYGSQTGNAQDVAERVAREAQLLLYSPAVMPMDSYPIQQLPEERFVIFVTATTGQGDPPDNMKRFWKLLLRKNLPPSILSGTHYAVFGLGDSGYVKYNVAAKKLDRRLAALGAVQLLERGLGDDQHPSGYEATLDPWLQQLWRVLRQHNPLPTGVDEPVLDASTLLQLTPPKYRITPIPPPDHQHLSQSQQQDALSPQQREQLLIEQAVAAAAAFRAVAAEASGLTSSSSAASNGHAGSGCGPWRPFMAPLLVNKRVTSADHFQETRYLEVDLAGSGLQYQPGDVLAIFPRTPAADVEAALQRLGLDGDAWVRIEAAHKQDQQQHAVCEAPIRAILQGVLDLSGCSPRRYLFQVLSQFTTHPLHKERLEYFATAEGRDDLYRYNQKERRSLLEVLQDFSSSSPPLERLLEAAPLLQPRQFSLASAPAPHGSTAAVLVAVVAWKTPSNRPRKGLVTSWLAGLQPAGDTAAAAAAGGVGSDVVRVPVWVDRGAFRLPPDESTPLLMVGPGTGVAPFRSFCWHRAARCLQQQQQEQQEGNGAADAAVDVSGSSSGSCLFFGCRSPFADFYFEQEWWPLMRCGALHPQHGLVAAFSRYSPQPTQQQLLQMLQHAAADPGQQQQHPAPPPANSTGQAPAVAELSSAGALAAAAGNAAEVRGRVYVTHKIKEHGAAVWQLLSQQGAWVYVSGSAEKMPAGVVAALEDVAAVHGGLTADAAAKFVRQLELTGRYHVEAWS